LAIRLFEEKLFVVGFGIIKSAIGIWLFEDSVIWLLGGKSKISNR
jgi:hypothetical protein